MALSFTNPYDYVKKSTNVPVVGLSGFEGSLSSVRPRFRFGIVLERASEDLAASQPDDLSAWDCPGYSIGGLAVEKRTKK